LGSEVGTRVGRPPLGIAEGFRDRLIREAHAMIAASKGGETAALEQHASNIGAQAGILQACMGNLDAALNQVRNVEPQLDSPGSP
jgi:hypothetical protein